MKTRAVLFGLIIGGIFRIVWAYWKDQSLLDATGIAVTTLALAALYYWLKSKK